VYEEGRLKQLGLKLALGGFATGLLLFTAQPSFASVSGELLTGGNGTLTVSATALTFTKNDSSGYSTEVATGTDLTFAGCSSGMLGTTGCLTQGEGVDVNGGNPITNLGPITDFLTFANTPSLVFGLDGYSPGLTNTNCAALTVGESCSVFVGSPVILTLTSSGGTAASMGIFGTASDGTTPVSTWKGNFTATIANKTPAQLQAIIANRGSFSHTHSGDFVVSFSPVPEPRSISLALGAALFLGIVVMRRKRVA
jgi:hypothetical protein